MCEHLGFRLQLDVQSLGLLADLFTLEQSKLDMPSADALDLVHRVASNARKLERLLGDLLDLDRLQRGIVSPQRRSTDIGALSAKRMRWKR
jgi:K+-sensing histidine kinase KdpD